MHNSSKFLHRFPIQQDIHLYELGRLVASILIIKAVEEKDAALKQGCPNCSTKGRLVVPTREQHHGPDSSDQLI